MKKVTVCFDVDGTLVSNPNNKNIEFEPIPNERIVNLLKIFSSFKNIKIIIWSGQGKAYAKKIGNKLSLTKYVHSYASKNHQGKDEKGKHIFRPDFIPDIAIDDIQACELGILNLIVKEK